MGSRLLLNDTLETSSLYYGTAVIHDIDDFFYDEVKDKFDIELSLEQMDKIIEKTMQIAKIRRK